MLAAQLHKSPDTVTCKIRLVALAASVQKRKKALETLQSMHAHLQKAPSLARATDFWQKYKYDEMSLKLNVKGQERVGGTVVAKLLQVVITWLAQWRLNDGKIVRAFFQIPVHLQCIEKNNSYCLINAMAPLLTLAPWIRSTWETLNKMPIADDHAANGLADAGLWKHSPEETPEKYICQAHKEDKIGRLQAKPFPNEKRGIQYVVLSCSFGGIWTALKANMQTYLRNVAKRYISTSGPGPEADRFREAVFMQFCSSTGSQKLHGRYTCRHLQELNAKRKLCTGDFRKENVFEHYCSGPPRCCSDESAFFDSIDKYIIDPMCVLQIHKSSSWDDNEVPADWNGFWLACHDVFSPVFKMTFPVPKKTKRSTNVDVLSPCDAIPDNHDDSHSDMEAEADGELDMPAPEKESTTEQRQSTYRSIANTWIENKPLGRLWVYRSVMRTQQNSQRKLRSHVGQLWDRTELQRRSQGQPRQYRALLAWEGAYTHPAMNEYSRLMTLSTAWSLPPEYQTHELSITAYRGAAAGAAAKYQLQVVVFREHLRGYALLYLRRRPDSAVALRVSEEMCEDFRVCCCKFSPWWFRHLSRFSTPEQLRSAESLDKIEAAAEIAEIDNVSVEANNATIRRFVARLFQGTRPDLADVSACWTLAQEAQEQASYFGAMPSAADSTLPKGAQIRGGGRSRAFVSKLSKLSEYRLPNGKLDFRGISQRWKAEVAKGDDSELLKECAEIGALATKARQAQHAAEQETGQRSAISSFGTVSRKTLRERNQHVQDRLALQELLNVHRADAAEITDATSLAAASESLAALQETHVGLCRQHKAIRRLTRIKGKEETQGLQEQDLKIRAELCEIDPASALVGLPLPAGVCLRVDHSAGVHAFAGTLPTVSKLVAQQDHMKTGWGAKALKAWQDSHGILSDSDVLPNSTIEEYWKPTLCCRMCSCVCQGDGFLKHLAAKSFTDYLLKLSPAKSQLRQWLIGGWLVIEIDGRFFHIAIMYLRPRRPTFIRMYVVDDDSAWGRRRLEPLFLVSGWPSCATPLEFVSELALDEPLVFRLHKFVHFNRSFAPWAPVKKLTIEAVESAVSEEHRWWSGAAAELEIFKIRMEAKVADAARRKERQRLGEAKQSRKETKKQRPPSQKPPACHPLIDMATLLSDASDEELEPGFEPSSGDERDKGEGR